MCIKSSAHVGTARVGREDPPRWARNDASLAKAEVGHGLIPCGREVHGSLFTHATMSAPGTNAALAILVLRPAQSVPMATQCWAFRLAAEVPGDPLIRPAYQIKFQREKISSYLIRSEAPWTQGEVDESPSVSTPYGNAKVCPPPERDAMS